MKKQKQDCVFCTKVINENRDVAENDLAWAFPTNIPITPGHLLVVPKRCVATFSELNADERLAILELQDKLTNALKSLNLAEGFNFAWNEGDVAGQSVPHLHLHIVPRKEDDKGIYEYDPRKFLYRPGSRNTSPDKELNEIASIIKKAL